MPPQTELTPLGILGGTFDPIHFGHLRLAEEAHAQLGLARVRLIPAGRPAHRGAPGAGAAHRLAMTRLAAAANPHLEVDAAEVLSDAPSYTVPTLERLRSELGAARPLVLLLGADAFAGLPSWHRWETLFALAHIAVATRPGHSFEPEALAPELAEHCRRRAGEVAQLAEAPGGLILRFPITPLDISATAIRAQCACHESPRYLLPDGVVDYIAQHRLYAGDAN
ncbi:nicotinate-nucleotide adenylyltransferase [Niveibacterium umoris]|uniref:Probable nicotinate-nucleotide adenylyltransferase n=1 Tax=Niveibacterium umoris TaxID=1193620 RepID=A0A840BVJ5_9RHOO|nr:nicotinate-nucleotide adenylyltransferase [Niveibacterium umoris]MBB4014337.1 nicotinate-nucleotide adenylyltransferase [Niveibacterium umoris]